MPIRTFLPLPGPFVFVGKSRIEKDYERQRDAERIQGISPRGKVGAGLVVAALIWFVLVRSAFLAGPVWGWLAAAVCAAWVVGVVASKVRRGPESWLE